MSNRSRGVLATTANMPISRSNAKAVAAGGRVPKGLLLWAGADVAFESGPVTGAAGAGFECPGATARPATGVEMAAAGSTLTVPGLAIDRTLGATGMAGVAAAGATVATAGAMGAGLALVARTGGRTAAAATGGTAARMTGLTIVTTGPARTGGTTGAAGTGMAFATCAITGVTSGAGRGVAPAGWAPAIEQMRARTKIAAAPPSVSAARRNRRHGCALSVRRAAIGSGSTTSLGYPAE